MTVRFLATAVAGGPLGSAASSGEVVHWAIYVVPPPPSSSSSSSSADTCVLHASCHHDQRQLVTIALLPHTHAVRTATLLDDDGGDGDSAGGRVVLAVGLANGDVWRSSLAAPHGAIVEGPRHLLTTLPGPVSYLAPATSTFLFAAADGGTWRLLGRSSGVNGGVAVDTSALPLHATGAPTCLCIIPPAAPPGRLDEGAARRYALVATCFGPAIADSGVAVVAVGTAGGATCWFPLPPAACGDGRLSAGGRDVGVVAQEFRQHVWGTGDAGEGSGRRAVQTLVAADLCPLASFAACARGGNAPPPAAPSSSSSSSSPAAFAASHLCAVLQSTGGVYGGGGVEGVGVGGGVGGGGLVLRCHGARPTAAGIVVADARTLPLSPPTPTPGLRPDPVFAGIASLEPCGPGGLAMAMIVARGGAVHAMSVRPTGAEHSTTASSALLCGDGDGVGGAHVLTAAVGAARGPAVASPVLWTLVHDHRSGRPRPAAAPLAPLLAPLRRLLQQQPPSNPAAAGAAGAAGAAVGAQQGEVLRRLRYTSAEGVLRRLRGAAAAARARSWAAAEVDGEALRVAALLALLEGEGERDAKVSALLCLPALLALLDQDAEQGALCFPSPPPPPSQASGGGVCSPATPLGRWVRVAWRVHPATAGAGPYLALSVAAPSAPAAAAATVLRALHGRDVTVLLSPTCSAAGGSAAVFSHTAPLHFAPTGVSDARAAAAGAGAGAGGAAATVAAPLGALDVRGGVRASLVLHVPFVGPGAGAGAGHGPGASAVLWEGEVPLTAPAPALPRAARSSDGGRRRPLSASLTVTVPALLSPGPAHGAVAQASADALQALRAALGAPGTDDSASFSASLRPAFAPPPTTAGGNSGSGSDGGARLAIRSTRVPLSAAASSLQPPAAAAAPETAAVTVEVLRVTGRGDEPALLPAAHAAARRASLAALAPAFAATPSKNDNNNAGPLLFAGADVYALPPPLQQAMAAAAEMARGLRQATAAGDSGADTNALCAAAPSLPAVAAGGNGRPDETDDEEDEEEDEGEDVGGAGYAGAQARRLWELYCAVREAAC